MSAQQKRPIGLWGWILRAGFVVGAGAGLLLLVDKGDVQHLANVVTIMVPAVAVYTLFDDRLLEFVVRTIRVVIERIKAARSANEEVDPEPRAVVQLVPLTRDADTEAEPAPEPGMSDEPSRTEASLQAVDRASWRHWAVAGLALSAALLLAVIVVERSVYWLSQSPASPERVVSPAAPETPVPVVADVGPVPSPEVAAAPAAPQTHDVISGDNCWDIAERCTGDGTRYPELGPPLNEIVIDPEGCPPPRTTVLRLPPDWPAGCAESR